MWWRERGKEGGRGRKGRLGNEYIGRAEQRDVRKRGRGHTPIKHSDKNLPMRMMVMNDYTQGKRVDRQDIKHQRNAGNPIDRKNYPRTFETQKSLPQPRHSTMTFPIVLRDHSITSPQPTFRSIHQPRKGTTIKSPAKVTNSVIPLINNVPPTSIW